MEEILLELMRQSPALAICLLWIRSLLLRVEKVEEDRRETAHFYRECQQQQADALDRHIDNEQRG